MLHRAMFAIAIVGFGLWCAMPASAASPAPATQPAGGPEFVVSDMRVQTIPGFSFLYQSSRTSLADISATATRTISELQAAIHDGKFRPDGPLVFIYHDMMDLSQPFMLDVGFMVPEGTSAFGSNKLQKIETFKCATVLFSGPLSHLSDAYGKVMEAVGRSGLRPTGTSREVYLYWENPQSTNNVVQIQIGIE